jgi:hypothetical protein
MEGRESTIPTNFVGPICCLNQGRVVGDKEDVNPKPLAENLEESRHVVDIAIVEGRQRFIQEKHRAKTPAKNQGQSQKDRLNSGNGPTKTVQTFPLNQIPILLPLHRYKGDVDLSPRNLDICTNLNLLIVEHRLQALALKGLHGFHSFSDFRVHEGSKENGDLIKNVNVIGKPLNLSTGVSKGPPHFLPATHQG